MKKLIALTTIVLGLIAVVPTQAHALAFPGLTVIDTEYNCPHVNNNQPQCYTWIRTNGVLRRGSPAQYFSEASGGFVFTACSSAAWHANRDYDPWNVDWNGVIVSPHFHWGLISNHQYCQSPVTPAGYQWTGYKWPVVNNPAPY